MQFINFATKSALSSFQIFNIFPRLRVNIIFTVLYYNIRKRERERVTREFTEMYSLMEIFIDDRDREKRYEYLCRNINIDT